MRQPVSKQSISWYLRDDCVASKETNLNDNEIVVLSLQWCNMGSCVASASAPVASGITITTLI